MKKEYIQPLFETITETNGSLLAASPNIKVDPSQQSPSMDSKRGFKFDDDDDDDYDF